MIEDAAERRHLYVVPADSAPLRALSSLDSNRTDVDQVLDDVFGDVDDEGPGATDAVLVAGGTAAVVTSQLAAVPGGVLVAGVAALALGAVIPIRSAIRRVKARRHDRQLRELLGDGFLLDSRSATSKGLIDAHGEIWHRSTELTDVQQLRIRNASHALVLEVATLLDGHVPSSASEIAYCNERLAAIEQLTALIDDVVASNKRAGRAEGVIGRREVEATAGRSALDDARELAADLRSMPDV